MAVILFDGVCNLCNSSVQFIIQRDSGKVFKFASLQSEIGKRYKELFNIPASTDSIVLLMNDKVYKESTAALLIASRLKWPWKWFRIFQVIPKPIRDKVYKWIAANRYKWFGRKESCMIPSKEDRDRFI
ncbi:thiol-disulfide oxidoreductase DCC family protein [Bacillus sp. V3]|nr:thiol-disulfide oxidoreductase DCC family protein [Bacillus sp. V3]